MTQCKKKVETITPATVDETVHISLSVEGGKHSVFPSTGAVVYTDGDVIYVGNNGKYVGSLTYADGAFSGDLTGVSTEDYLHFFFIGCLTPGTTPTAGTTTSFSIDISNQRNKLPVLSYGKSNIKYTSGTTAYSSILENQCALVKFTLDNDDVPNPISLTGLRTTAVIDFANSAVTPNSSTGTITTYIDNDSGWGYRYAIVFATQAILLDKSGSILCGGGSVEYDLPTAASANAYLTDGTINVTSTGGFTINSSGDQVIFSQGNLQYQASTGTWRFAENQYDYVGNATYGNVYENGVKCNNANISSTYTGWIDLFGWGTSGYNHGAVCYQPWSTSTNSENYLAYGSSSNNLYSNTGQADWGYNAISNGGNTENSGWRTLTNAEWNYLLFTRTGCSTINGIENARYSRATVAGVYGLMIFPDNFSWPTSVSEPASTAINKTGNVTAGSYEADDWTLIESKGVVFVPCAGERRGIVFSGISSIRQWSSVYGQYFYSNEGNLGTFGTSEIFLGYSIRCVLNK